MTHCIKITSVVKFPSKVLLFLINSRIPYVMLKQILNIRTCLAVNRGYVHRAKEHHMLCRYWSKIITLLWTF